MKRSLFKYKMVYYFAIFVSVICLFISLLMTMGLFSEPTFFKVLLMLFFIVSNILSTISLLEKYKQAVLYLNINIIAIIILLMANILFVRYVDTSKQNWLLFFIVYFVVINLAKNKNLKSDIAEYNDIENIGKNE